MNADTPPPLPLYAVTDKTHDGRRRVIDTFRDPDAALSAAKLLRWTGSPVEVVLVTAVEGERA